MVERSVEEQIGVGVQLLLAALVPGDRVVSGEPDKKSAGGEFVFADPSARDDESRDGFTGFCAVRFERVNAVGVVQVSISLALNRVGDRLSNPSRCDTSLPSLEAPRMAPRHMVCCSCYPGNIPRTQAGVVEWL